MAAAAAATADSTEASRKHILTSFANPSANAYEKRMGVITRPMASHIISTLALPPTAHILDNACGTGAVTSTFLSTYPNGKVTATDASPPMIEAIRSAISQNGWEQSVTAEVMDAQALKLDAETFDAAIMHFGIWFLPDPAAGASEMYGVLKPQGSAVITTGKETPLTYVFTAVQDEINPAQKSQGVSGFHKWSLSETMVQLFKDAGFADVEISELTEVQWAPSIAELADALAGNLKIMAGGWTDEEKARIDETTRRVLQARRGEFGVVEEAGRVGLPWTVLVSKATKP